MPEMKSSERPTLKTIARLSGLAVPTVSRALNDAPDIGEATKARVRDIAREIGYRPNRAGLRLRTGKTNVIALILSTEHDMMNNTARLLTAIAAGTRDTPYHMIVTPYFPDQDPMDPVRYVTETRSADGIIMNQTQPEDPRVQYLMDIGFPFATHGRTNWSDQHPYFDFHNGTFGALAVRKLAARGRKSLALVAPPKDQFYSIEMIDGARREAEKLGLSFEVFDSVSSDDPAAIVECAVRTRQTGAHPLDGVISASINAAMAVVSGLEGAGSVIGEDVDVVAKEAMSFLNRFRKEIIVVKEDVPKAGAFLCRAIMQAIDHPELPPMQYLEHPQE